MPITRNYTGGSIIYFQGDKGEDTYVLQQGRVTLISNSPETGEEIREEAQIGEFIGIKSSIGRFPREETAQVIGKATVIVFKFHEFEQFILKNPRIILQTLKVFSKQLRQVHRQTRNILKVGAARDPAYELMNVAESFFRSGSPQHATYALQKYLSYYPSGRFVKRAGELLAIAEKGQTFPYGYPPLEQEPGAFDSSDDLVIGGVVQSGAGETTASSSTNNGKGPDYQLVDEGKKQLAQKLFEPAAGSFTQYLKKHPQGNHAKEAMYNLAILSLATGNKARAKSLFQKVASTPPTDPFSQEAKKRLEKLA